MLKANKFNITYVLSPLICKGNKPNVFFCQRQSDRRLNSAIQNFTETFWFTLQRKSDLQILRQLKCFGPVKLTNFRQNNNFLLFQFQLQQLLQSSCPRLWVFARFMEEHSSLLRGTGSAEETNEDIFGLAWFLIIIQTCSNASSTD